MSRYDPNDITSDNRREARLDAVALAEACLTDDNAAYNTITADYDEQDAAVMLMTLAQLASLLAETHPEGGQAALAIARKAALES